MENSMYFNTFSFTLFDVFMYNQLHFHSSLSRKNRILHFLTNVQGIKLNSSQMRNTMELTKQVWKKICSLGIWV